MGHIAQHSHDSPRTMSLMPAPSSVLPRLLPAVVSAALVAAAAEPTVLSSEPPSERAALAAAEGAALRKGCASASAAEGLRGRE
jgi:hypothetical protein